MLKRLVVQDALRVWILLTGCLVGGILVNEMRPKPIPLIYISRQVRLDHAVSKWAPCAVTINARGGNIELDEIQQFSDSRSALILDARPEIFYRIGHIPSALSLPRDDFDKQYPIVRSFLELHRGQPIVVYCASRACEDSQLVADALERLGYGQVRVFRGGWSDWESGHLPEEKE